LEGLLHAVRTLADFEESSSLLANTTSTIDEISTVNGRDISSDDVEQMESVVSPLKSSSSPGASFGDKTPEPSTVPSQARRLFRYGDLKLSSPSELLMVNFRELLWYWKEYYLRRGRDRLSIEFSSHAPFHKWIELVGTSSNNCHCRTNICSCVCRRFVHSEKLCADDGSPLSLLTRPIRFPRTPYGHPSRNRDSNAAELSQFL
jgi:hypothetical protein